MLGLTDPLHDAPALAARERFLRKVVIPGVDDELERRDRRESAVQRRRRHIGAERVGHRLHDRLAVLEIFDELRRRRQVLADFVRHACLGDEATDETSGEAGSGQSSPASASTPAPR